MADIVYTNRGASSPTTKSFVAPEGVTSVKVELWGGGGGGGGLAADNVVARGGGGAGGQYAVDNELTITEETVYPNVAASLGTIGVGATSALAGNDSTFNTTSVVAKGGAGGASYENGGAGGVGSTTSGVGDTVYAGGSGSDGGAVTTGGAGGGGAGSTGAGGGASGNTAGTGTSLYGGNGGSGRTSSGAGGAGSSYGGGGGAGANTVSNSTTNRNGGVGAAGQVRVTYAYSGKKPVLVGQVNPITGTTSLSLDSVVASANPQSGDLYIIGVANKHGSVTPTTPTDFTAPTNYTQSGGDSSQESTVDRGTARASVFYKQASGSETTTSITLTSGNSSVGTLYVFRKPTTTSWGIECVNGSENTGGSEWGVTADQNLEIKANDIILAISGINTDGRTFTNPSISATGITFSSHLELDEVGTTQGNDCKLYVTMHSVSSTSGSATVAPVFTATPSASTTYDPKGATIFVRIRAVPSAGNSERGLYAEGATAGTNANSERGLYATGTNPYLATLQDDFNDNSINPTIWNNSGGGQITEANGVLNITTTTSAVYYGIETDNVYNATGSSVYVELVDAGNLALTSLEVSFSLVIDANNKIFFNISGYDDTITAFKRVSGSNTNLASTTYSSTNHRWLRFRESSGTTYFETSANGTSWNTFHSVANPITMTALKVDLTAGTWDTEGSGTVVKFDNVNIVPSVDANSERGLYSTGKASANSEKGLYSTGKSSSESTRGLYASAMTSGNSEKGLYAQGSSTGDSTRNIYGSGKNTANSEKGLYAEGSLGGDSERGIYASGIDTDGSSVGLYATGSASAYSSRGLYASGVASDGSTRGIYAIGNSTGDSTRGLYAEAIETNGTERGLYAQGIDTDASERNIYAVGNLDSFSVRSLYTSGIATGFSEVNLFIEGEGGSSSDRGLYAVGYSTDNSDRGVYAVGSISNGSDRGLYAEGVEVEGSERNVYATGLDSDTSEVGLYAEGVLLGDSERGLYAEGLSSGEVDLKRWNGSEWVQVTLKRYNGSTWESPVLKVYTSEWKLVKVSP